MLMAIRVLFQLPWRLTRKTGKHLSRYSDCVTNDARCGSASSLNNLIKQKLMSNVWTALDSVYTEKHRRECLIAIRVVTRIGNPHSN